MAPPAKIVVASKDKEKRIHSYIDFVRDLETKLSSLSDDGKNEILSRSIADEIRSLSQANVRDPVQSHYKSLDGAGTSLWNASVRAQRKLDDSPGKGNSRVLMLSRVLAFSLLDMAHPLNSIKPNSLIRLAKLAIKAGRLCLDNKGLEFASLVLQKAAEYNATLSTLRQSLPEDDQNTCQSLEVEYFGIRTALSWMDNRLDVAEHMYEKADDLKQHLTPSSAEMVADTFYEIGQGLMSRKDFARASTWLERAQECLLGQPIDRLSRNALELKLTISQAMVKSLLGMESSEAFEKAESLVSAIELDVGDRLMVLLLRLELLQSVPPEIFDSQSYGQVLRKINNSVGLSESSFKVMVHHLQKLHAKCPSLACEIMDQFIQGRVVPASNSQWLAKAVVLRTYMSTNGRESESVDASLRELFDVLSDKGLKMPAEAAVAILGLLWKQIEAVPIPEHLDRLKKWCQLALHAILEPIGQTNQAKIQRQVVSKRRYSNDMELANEVQLSLSDSSKDEPMTLFALYRLALQREDANLAFDCIKSISRASSKDPKFLYACCVSAQQSGNRLVALGALKELAMHVEHTDSGDTHAPALFRSLIRLQMHVIGNSPPEIPLASLLEDLCQTLESATRLIQRDSKKPTGDRKFTVDELNWFSRNSYNTGLEYLNTWELPYVIRVFQNCISIISCFPKEIHAQDTSDLSLRQMFCNFVVASAMIVLARVEDNIESRLQMYLEARKFINSYSGQLENNSQNLGEIVLGDLQQKLGALLVFDFEAAAALKSWDDLSSIARRATASSDLNALQAMADCMLRNPEAPVEIRYSTLRTLINQIWTLEKFDVQKLAKYLRCLLQVTLPFDSAMALDLIQEISERIKEFNETNNAFPGAELEWIITTSFNHAVDLYLSQQDEMCKEWVAHAVNMAEMHRDGGVLAATLRDHYAHLTWDSSS